MSSHAAGSSIVAPGSAVGSSLGFGVGVSDGSALALGVLSTADGVADDVAEGPGSGAQAARAARRATDAATPAMRSTVRGRRGKATGSMGPPRSSGFSKASDPCASRPGDATNSDGIDTSGGAAQAQAVEHGEDARE